MDAAERSLQELLLQRITDDGQLPERVGELVLAAWDGEAELEAELSGHRTAGERSEPVVAAERPPELYLRAVHVEGFRGVGEAVTLVPT